MKSLPLVARTGINLFLIFSLLIFSVPFTEFSGATSCSTEQDCQAQIDQQNSQLSSIQQQQASLQAQLNSAQKNLNSTQAQLNDFQNKASDITNQLNKATNDLNNAQAILDKNKADFKSRVVDLYERGIFDRFNLFMNTDFSYQDAAQLYSLNYSILKKNQELISQYTTTVKNLVMARDQVAQAKQLADQQLAQIQAIRNQQVAQIASFQRSQSAINSQLSDVTKNLTNLTSQQQAIIAAKLAASQQDQTVGATAPGNYTVPPPPFTNAFVFMTYGYPHRVGMNQYGAYGRSRQGQDYQTILNAYYANITIGSYTEPATIPVQGYGNIPFEDNYLKGIGEMPTGWGGTGGMEALKAQAVAARTYALNWLNTHPGQSICTDQNCQVYIGSDKGSYWDQAVDATRGIVVTYQGTPITAWYASTAGGYTRTSQDVWGGVTPYTKEVKDYDPTGQPYDVISPWYHKAWGDAGNGSPWLTEAQTEDLFNAAILYTATNSTTGADYNLTQPDKGGSSPAQIVSALQARNLTPVGNLTSISTHNDGTGYTDTVTVNGSRVFDGHSFRSVFQIRSLGTLAIWTSLFDVCTNKCPN